MPKMTDEMKKKVDSMVKQRAIDAREAKMGKTTAGKEDVERLKFIRKNRKKFTDKQLAEMFDRLRN